MRPNTNNTKLTPEFLAQKTFDLYQTHGVPIEVSESILAEKQLELDKDYLNSLIENHQKLSQQSSSGQFKSGLGNDSDKTRKLHTTTHILHQVLRDVFGDEVKQMGSAITDEKARFDFSLDSKELTDEKLEMIKQTIQDVIDKNLIMKKIETTEKKAREMGAIGLFGEKYSDNVNIYILEDEKGKIYSKEFCGGPHIENTSQIGTFNIIKKKSIGSNLSRIEFNVE
jgi:alanyl-tRNA synthetase